MDDIADLLRRFENLIRFGHVIAIDGGKVRVASGNLETNWINWVSLAAGDDRDWHAPSIEEQVVLLCPSGDPANGIALRGVYSDTNSPPSTDPAVRLFRFRDGTTISYDTVAHFLHADVMGKAGISTTGDLGALVGGRCDIEVAGALNATAASIKAEASGAAELTASTAVVTATTITLNGAVIINGSLQLNGPLTALPGPGGAGGASITGDVEINGEATANDFKAGTVSLSGHTHMSSAPDTSTSPPEA